VAFCKAAAHLPWEQAAGVAAVEISNSDPARPMDGRVVAGLAAPAVEDRLSREEQEDLLYSGVTPLDVNDAGEVTIVRAITTYTTNAGGTQDEALLDIGTIDSLNYMREAWVAAIKKAFPQGKLEERTPASVEDVIYATSKKAEKLGIVRNVDANKPKLHAEEDANTSGQINVAIPAAIVPGLHKVCGSIMLILH